MNIIACMRFRALLDVHNVLFLGTGSVYLKYIGNFDVPDMRTAEQIEADRIAEEKLEAKRAYHRQKTQNYVDKKRAAEAEKAVAEKAKSEKQKSKTAKPKTAKTA